ncbi:MAG: hypothetical protein HOE90_23270 [Bacteriovoracaceae bacterium]|jgi:response regulator RpfG family c-di-GMP phosphodiesterase|nr:hypothetical protein [Bacteriovoracaceae bacterium]
MALKPILIAHESVDLRSLIHLCVESQLENPIIEVKNGKEAIKALDKYSGEFELICSGYQMEPGSGDELYAEVKKRKLLVPFLLISAYRPEELEALSTMRLDNPSNSFILKKNINGKSLMDAVQTMLGHGDDSNKNDQNYSKIRISKFIENPREDVDLYVRLSEGKLVKRFKKGDLLDIDGLKKFQDKGVEYFFLTTEDYLSYIKHESQKIFESFEVVDSSPEAMANLQVKALEESQEILNNIGVDPHLTNIVKASVGNIVGSVSKKKNVQKMISSLVFKKDYLYSHSILTSFLGCSMMQQLNWATEEGQQKMVYAALLHDIYIKDEGAARVKILSGSLYTSLSPSLKKDVKEHMKKSGDLLTKISNFPEDARTMILDHHETPEGDGFPRKLTASNTPVLSCLFILAHDVADFLITRFESGEGTSDFAQLYQKRFDVGNYQKPLQALLSVIGR